MKGWILTVLITIAMVIQSILAIVINYPPTEEQLKILLFLDINGNFSLWLLRFLSLILLGLVLRVWQKAISEKIFKWSLVMLLISPTFFVLWYLFPLMLLKVFLVMSVIYLIIGNKFNRYLLVLFLILGIVGYNRLILNNRAAVFNKLSFRDAQNEVTTRFVTEDSLKSKIELPLWWRRIAYNKIFFVYKQVTAEVLPFFDLETLFFQEVTPVGQKSIVMWYWPEMYVLIFGIYFWLKRKDKKLNRNILLMFLVAITDFVFSEGASYRRLFLIMWPTSIIMAIAWEEMIILSKKKYILASWCLGVVGVLLISAFGFNFYDLKVREEYWFDNRPLVFQFWYKNLSKIDLNNYQKIYISSLVGDPKAYCNFYLGKVCEDKKWIFKNFNLAEDKINNKTIYAGFAGEFVGPKFKNDVSSDWQKQVELRGISFLAVRNLRDTIANQYGNEVAVAVKE